MDMASLREFWDLVGHVWREGAYGIDVAEMLMALGGFAIFLFLRDLFGRFIVAACQRAAARTKMHIDDSMVQALNGPTQSPYPTPEKAA